MFAEGCESIDGNGLKPATDLSNGKGSIMDGGVTEFGVKTHLYGFFFTLLLDLLLHV